ncbi:MAG: RNA methyltransferase [Beijerinckiaceae bacterium]
MNVTPMLENPCSGCVIGAALPGRGQAMAENLGDLRPPVVVLVQPQMGENIGMAARAMANFGLLEMRIVAPRDGWPNARAIETATGATDILDRATLYPSVREAVADCHCVWATTARARGQGKRVVAPRAAMQAVVGGGVAQRHAVLFGPERTGLANDDISLADAILTFPVSPGHTSLNMSQAVLLVGYEWFVTAHGGAPAFDGKDQGLPATREMVHSFFDFIETELDQAGFFVPDAKRALMQRNFRNILHRLAMTEQDVRTLRGAAAALVNGRRRRKDAGMENKRDGWPAKE